MRQLSWRTNKRTKNRFRSGGSSRTIFGEARDQAIAQEVHATSVADAERSVASLEADFSRSETRAKRERIWRSTLDEANRLEIGAHRMDYYPEVRRNMAEREGVFRRAASRMHGELWDADGRPR